ncbi:NUDIX domain-containing protein [Chloroflexota bacterium]
MPTGRILIGVGAVIEDETGRVLLVMHLPKRGGYWQGKWICPGGELELGETIPEGIRREIKEETGLDVTLTRPLPPFERIVMSGNQVSLHVVYIDYMAKLTGGALKAASDVGRAMWVEKEKLGSIAGELHEDTITLLAIAGIME